MTLSAPMITLHYHPYSRASNVVWMLEELGVAYELAFADFMKGQTKSPEFLAKNPMGKLPVVEDDGVVVTESAAIALYLADRYAAGRLAPAIDDPRRAAYLRWSFFAPSVIEPGVMAHREKWEAKPTAVGWGTYDAMLAAIEQAVSGGDYLLGDTFTMADVVFGGTLLYMIRFKLLTPSAKVAAYAERLSARPAYQRAEARNEAERKAHGLG